MGGEKLIEELPQLALGGGMVTAIIYLLLRLIQSYGSVGDKWKGYAERLEKDLAEERKRKK